LQLHGAGTRRFTAVASEAGAASAIEKRAARTMMNFMMNDFVVDVVVEGRL
jgi:hypothetical protein